MKWYKLLLVLGAFLLTAFVIDKLYAPIPTWADHMLQQYNKEKDSIGIILIGNSHTGAIRDKRIGNLPVMNFSIAGIELNERRTLIGEIIRSKGSLRYVIMSMDYDQVGHQTSESHIGNMLLPYSLAQDKSLMGWVKKINANNFLRHNRDFSVLRKYYTTGIDFNKELNFVPVGFKNKNDVEACKKRALELSKLYFREAHMDNNLKLVKEINYMLSLKGIQLILLNTPKTSCLTQEYRAQFKPEYKERVIGFAKANNIPFLDFQGHSSFTDEDFLDFDHLNTQGSVKLCNMIAVMLKLDSSNLK